MTPKMYYITINKRKEKKEKTDISRKYTDFLKIEMLFLEVDVLIGSGPAAFSQNKRPSRPPVRIIIHRLICGMGGGEYRGQGSGWPMCVCGVARSAHSLSPWHANALLLHPEGCQRGGGAGRRSAEDQHEVLLRNKRQSAQHY